MITQEMAEKAVDWLRDHADEMAKARATRLYIEQWMKSHKAALQMQTGESSVARAEVEALADARYHETLLAYKAAVENDEFMRWTAAAAEAKIEFWRSQEATRRIEGKATT